MAETKAKTLGTKESALVYCELITAAKYRGTVKYQELAKLIGIPLSGNYMQSKLGKILGEISEYEVEQGRPMLSAIAVNVNELAGTGFYVLARELGKLQDQSQEEFWEDEKKSVYETWKMKLKE
jgi:hypothetical protein